MGTDRRPAHVSEPTHVSDEEKAELEDEARERNPDRTTRREALELELMEEDRSEVGEEIGDEIE
jgi:hypothetical protein